MKRIPLACELFSVHKLMAEDMAATVKAVADIGYEGVEFYSGIEKDAEKINKIVKDAGVKVCGWHSAWSDLDDANIDATIAFHKAIGNKFIIVPGLPKEMTATAADWHNTAKLFNEKSKILAQHGIELGYHNHGAEFQPLDDGSLAWDIMGQEAGPDVILQLDNGNAMSGGGDSLAFLKKYPKRARTIHLKPYSLKDGFKTMIGEDDVPWKETFAEVERQGVTEWYILEYECEEAYSEMEGVKVSYARLKELGL